MKKQLYSIFILAVISLLFFSTLLLYRDKEKSIQATADYLTQHSIFEDIYFSSNNEYMQQIKLYTNEDMDAYHAYLPTSQNDPVRIYFSHCSGVIFNDTELSSGDILPAITPEIPYLVQAVNHDNEVIDESFITFFFSDGIPAVYINTETGTMEHIHSDKEISEKASYAVYTSEGNIDSVGECYIKGRGNSSWSKDPKPYNLNLKDSDSILGMDSVSDWALLANSGTEFPQLNNKLTFELARQIDLAYTPQSEFVNLYLNGEYNGLYLLAQRVSASDGTVKISDLGSVNQQINSTQKLPGIFENTTQEGHLEHGILYENNPDDISGGYLLEFDSRYTQEISYFTTNHQNVVIKSPKEASQEQVSYIASLVREAEDAIYDETGVNIVTGKSYLDYLDLDSWSKVFMMQDFFVQWDVEYSSFYLYKQKQDPLLYAGPVWDFDLSCGKMYMGDYPLLSQHVLWTREVNGRWLHALSLHDDFSDYVNKQYLETLLPAINEILEYQYSNIITPLIPSGHMHSVRWDEEDSLEEEANNLYNWLTARQQFIEEYYSNPDAYYCVNFEFAWGSIPYYVKKNTSLNFLPCDEYGEKDKNGSVYGYTDIIGWIDESGNEIFAEDIITEDTHYYPIYEMESDK